MIRSKVMNFGFESMIEGACSGFRPTYPPPKIAITCKSQRDKLKTLFACWQLAWQIPSQGLTYNRR